tara:strand:- start:583 stop:738 length:156 start_codon:yes stop_codon:yes gene_type:complete
MRHNIKMAFKRIIKACFVTVGVIVTAPIWFIILIASASNIISKDEQENEIE